MKAFFHNLSALTSLRVKGVFSLARRLAPCVVFIDEVDSLFGARSGRGGGNLGNRSHDQLLTEFMQEMDGLSSADANMKKGIVVIGATNRPFDLDDAILRRLPRRLLVDLPDAKARRGKSPHCGLSAHITAILDIMLRGEDLTEDVDLDHIASETDGFSGSDLKRERKRYLSSLTCRSLCLCSSERHQGSCQGAMEDCYV